jgi:hypothetical protein
VNFSFSPLHAVHIPVSSLLAIATERAA